mgnify:CR=1 FL=1
MVFHQGRYSGTGSNLVALCFDGITDDIYAYDWILKMALTILTLSSGFIGGEVAPLFSIGSCLGYVLGPVFGFDPMFGAWRLDSPLCSVVDPIHCLLRFWSVWKVLDIQCFLSSLWYALCPLSLTLTIQFLRHRELHLPARQDDSD